MVGPPNLGNHVYHVLGVYIRELGRVYEVPGWISQSCISFPQDSPLSSEWHGGTIRQIALGLGDKILEYIDELLAAFRATWEELAIHYSHNIHLPFAFSYP